MTGPAVCRCLRLSVSRENDALNPDCSTENRQQGEADLRKITIWLAGSLLHCNAQRPGAVTNTTVSGCHSLLHRTRDIQNDPGGEPQNCHNRQAKLTADRSLWTSMLPK